MPRKTLSKPPPKHFIEEWRLYRGFRSQKALADATAHMKGGSISYPMMSKLINGRHNLTTNYMKIISSALKCEPGDLLHSPPTDARKILPVDSDPPTADFNHEMQRSWKLTVEVWLLALDVRPDTADVASRMIVEDLLTDEVLAESHDSDPGQSRAVRTARSIAKFRQLKIQ